MTIGAGAAWRWAPLVVSVGVAVAWRGGYTADGRAVVVALAGLAALAALTVAPDAAAAAARHPIALALGALAAITALTAAWTIGDAGDAARDAAAVLALAALMVAAAALPAPAGQAAVLLVAGVATAVAGLVATAVASDPVALDICGSWRPAGPFQYPPALALACVSATPVALGAASDRRRGLAIGGALAAWLLLVTVGLTANRTAVGLAALAVVACVALAPRGRAVGPVALAVVVAATASTSALHGDLHRAGDAARALALVPLALVLVAALWTNSARVGGAHRGRCAVLVAVVGLAVTGGVLAADHAVPCGADPSHGRVGIWRAAIDTAAERPVQGYGAGTFLAATRDQQLTERTVPTRFAHDLALQEWVELGAAGLAAVLALYAAVGWTLVRELGRRRAGADSAAWLLAPAVAAFPLANVLDWPWALLGAGALWAVAVGGLVARPGATAPLSAAPRSARAPSRSTPGHRPS